MSKKSKKRAAERAIATAAEREKRIEAFLRREQNKPKNKKKIIIISAIAGALIIALVLGIVFSLLPGKKFSYTESALSEYIEISEEDYKGYTVSIKKQEATDADVERKIMRLLYQNRGAQVLGGATIYAEPIEIGDEVNIYYRGYVVDENGREITFEDNTLRNKVTLGVGSLAFASGFEESLIGVIPWEHNYNPETDRFTSGLVESGDVIYVSYTAIYPDGTSAKRQNDRIDLKAMGVDGLYGEGFSDFIVGSEIAKALDAKTFAYGDGEVVYADMTVNSAVRYKNPPLTLDATFPLDYETVELRGKTVKFDVYFNGMICYTPAVYDEAFITETLKLTAEALAEYEGGTIIEKHRALLFAEAEADSVELKETLISEQIWAHLNEKVNVKKLPSDEVALVYEQVYGTLIQEYNSYYQFLYSSIDAYARAKYNLSSYDSITAVMENEAKSIVTEKLIFYYIARAEKLLPTGEAFSAAYDALVLEHLNYFIETSYKEELDKITDEQEKNQKIEQIKAEMLEYYGEGYFEELVYYEAALDKIFEFATVVEE